MKKSRFISMIMGTIGGILFSIGMCMCLIAEWNAFNEGIAVTCIGSIALIFMVILRGKMEGKPSIKLSAKTIGIIILGSIGVLTLGTGLCMTILWSNLIVPGIIVGVIGIILLICLVITYKGVSN